MRQNTSTSSSISISSRTTTRTASSRSCAKSSSRTPTLKQRPRPASHPRPVAPQVPRVSARQRPLDEAHPHRHVAPRRSQVLLERLHRLLHVLCLPRRADGQQFIADAQKAGKDIYVWTVNRKDEMIEATRWGVKAVLTDKTALFQDLRKNMTSDFATTRQGEVGMFFRWATWRYYSLPQYVLQNMWMANIEKRAGSPFREVAAAPAPATSLAASANASTGISEKRGMSSSIPQPPVAVHAAA